MPLIFRTFSLGSRVQFRPGLKSCQIDCTIAAQHCTITALQVKIVVVQEWCSGNQRSPMLATFYLRDITHELMNTCFIIHVMAAYHAKYCTWHIQCHFSIYVIYHVGKLCAWVASWPFFFLIFLCCESRKMPIDPQSLKPHMGESLEACQPSSIKLQATNFCGDPQPQMSDPSIHLLEVGGNRGL